MLIDSLGAVKNVNIVNINTNKGTSSNDAGFFEIYVTLGDSLRITTIQHQTKVIQISHSNYQNKFLTIQLDLKTYSLDPFDLKKHNLSGRLGIDSKSVPKQKKILY